MECLNNLIGIRGDGNTAPFSGLYLNDLTGITIESADAAISAEVQSGFQLLRDKISFAQQAIKAEMRNFLQGSLRAENLIEADNIGYYEDDMEVLTADPGNYRGIQIQSDDCKHAELVVNSLSFRAQSSGDVTVKVFDLITGKELESITVAALADEIVTTQVNRSYKATSKKLNLLFVYDAATESYKTNTYAGKAICCGSQAGMYSNTQLYFRGASIAASAMKTHKNVSSLSHTSGLSLSYSLQCTAEPLICSIASILAYPILYKAASLIMMEYRYSRRLNSIISLHGKDHEALREEYELAYTESMQNIMKNLRMPHDICYSCQERVKHRTHIP